MRSVTFSVALAVLAAACALVEAPMPAGTFMVQGEVRNMRPGPVELEVRTPAGVLPGAVQPASLPAGPSNARVTYHLPMTGEWSIAVNGDAFISSSDFGADIRQGCIARDRTQRRRVVDPRLQRLALEAAVTLAMLAARRELAGLDLHRTHHAIERPHGARLIQGLEARRRPWPPKS